MNILCSASDPGGANSIVTVAQHFLRDGSRVGAVLEGPARDVFARAGISFVEASEMSDEDLAQYISAHKPDVFLAGRSAGLTIDKKILLLLKNTSAKSVYVLDFWTNYTASFSEKDKDFLYLPDIVCVMDEIARKEMVEEGFPADKLHVTGNPYFDNFTNGITCKNENSSEVLFISQPFSVAHSIPGMMVLPFDEYSVLSDIVKIIDTLPIGYNLVIRPHPLDPVGAFNSYISDRVRVSSLKSLEEDLSDAGLVVGMNSPVLLQAAVAGKHVISYEPGLIGNDPLVSNRVGITKRIDNKEELADAIKIYTNGPSDIFIADVNSVWPKGATERVASEISRLLNPII